jgi:hypothetical protein
MQAVIEWPDVQFFLLVLISSRRLLLSSVVFFRSCMKNTEREHFKCVAVSFFQTPPSSLLTIIEILLTVKLAVEIASLSNLRINQTCSNVAI